MAQTPPARPPRVIPPVVKTTTAATLGGSLLVLSGLTLTATVIGLTVATPPLVLFSPVLLPALGAAVLLIAGFLAAGAMGSTATFVFYWVFRYLTGRQPVGVAQLEHARTKLAGAVHQLRERAEHYTTGEGF